MKERAIGHGQRELYGNTDEIRVAYVSEDDVLLVSNNGVMRLRNAYLPLGAKFSSLNNLHRDIIGGTPVPETIQRAQDALLTRAEQHRDPLHDERMQQIVDDIFRR